MRNVLIAALIVLGPAAAHAQNNSSGIFSNKYLQDQINNSKDKTIVRELEWESCIEVVGDNEYLYKYEGWKAVTETETDDQLTVLFSKGRKRERMTCYKDQLIIDRWTSTLK